MSPYVPQPSLVCVSSVRGQREDTHPRVCFDDFLRVLFGREPSQMRKSNKSCLRSIGLRRIIPSTASFTLYFFTLSSKIGAQQKVNANWILRIKFVFVSVVIFLFSQLLKKYLDFILVWEKKKG
ncbi:hypothetical protein CDAR_608891 [Caerostris darwini]|uniref:Transmembrane protein n=1 Tax=Caerostris darwini TaxID=1538125 RepID=A0AAV4WKF4_9ARAC|nr:hypothetical protein CDAR_608891 [Caerostris darwini]